MHKNLLIETINIIEKNNKSWEDVTDVFISGKYNIGKDKFYKLAAAANYVLGNDLINAGLIIKGTDFVVEVREENGYLSYLNFVNLEVPKRLVEIPQLFTLLNYEYFGD